MKKNYLKKAMAITLENVSKKTVNSSGCCVWFQPTETKSLEKLKCKKKK